MENKHSAYDLIQMQSLPLDAKINMSRRRIIDWYEHWEADRHAPIDCFAFLDEVNGNAQ